MTKQRSKLILAELLQHLSESKSDIFFVQIGANDGMRFDPLNECIRKHRWKGLLVEPLPDIFSKLRQNYEDVPGLMFENVAIDEQNGINEIMRASPQILQQLPAWQADWVAGSATLSKRHNELSIHFCPALRDNIITQLIATMTLKDLLDKHAIERMDVFQIDTEGYDYKVLRQLDFTKYQPSIINLEFAYLTPEEKNKTLELLAGNGYTFQQVNLDLVAAHERFAKI